MDNAAPAFMPDLKLSFSQLGIIVILGATKVAIGACIIKSITKYYGLRKGSVGANLGQTLFNGATRLVASFGQMLGVRSLMGFGFGSMYG